MKSIVTTVTIVALFVAAVPAAAVAQSAPPPPPLATISAEDTDLLEHGEYALGERILSGAVGTFFGFGTGQAVQGRWLDRGWIFTAGELGSIGALLAGMGSCVSGSDGFDGDGGSVGGGCNTGLIAGGVIGLLAFRAWEVADVWAAPGMHNRKVRRARSRAYRMSGYVTPTGSRSAVAGLSLSF